MNEETPRWRTLWIGTFPAAGIGTPAGLGEGIWRTRLDLVTGALTTPEQVCRTPAPSFLATAQRGAVIHATAETEPDGRLTSWLVDGDGLREVASVSSRGPSPTHLALAPGALLACDYGDGTVAAAPLDARGAVREPVRAARRTGSGPVPGRQDGPHAHSATLAPGGRIALVCDLGTDELRRILLGGAVPGILDEGDPAFRFRPGSGPRHALFRPGGRLLDVVTELSAEVVTLAWDGESAHEVARRPTTDDAGTGVASDPARICQPSHLAASTDARLLYVANRGPGTISVFARHPDGVRLLGEVATGSTWPRHFAVVPGRDGREFLVVAGQLAWRLHVLVRDPGADMPRPTGHGADVPSPAFVLPR